MKRLVFFLLVFVMVFSCMSYLPTETQAASASNVRLAGTAKYGSERYTGKDYNINYYYDDAYFADSSYNENPSLATMSLITCMAGARSNEADWKNKSKNLKALWQDLGFEDYYVNKAYRSKPEDDTTAIGVASKKIDVDGKKYTLICLVINGLRLYNEWGGNVVLGTSGDYYGGRKGADEAMQILRDYMEDQDITGNVKLWLVGYGAGAGKCNLLAADIDNGAKLGNSVKLDPKNLYAYMFNCSRVTPLSNGLQDKVYENIHVFNNSYNCMRYFVPDRYYFGTYGVIHDTPTKNGDRDYRTKVNNMKQMLKHIDGSSAYNYDEFTMYKLNPLAIFDNCVSVDSSKHDDLAEFAHRYVDEIADVLCDNRDHYVSNFQDDLASLWSYILGGLDDSWPVATGYFIENLREDLFSIGWDIIWEKESDLAGIYEKHMRSAMKKAGVLDYDESELVKFARCLAKIVIPMGKSYANDSITFVLQMDYIINALDPVDLLAWSMVDDPNYTADEGINIAFCNAKLSKTSYNYSGSAKKPSVTITNGSQKLVKDEDFIVSYKNNKKPGKASVMIEGIGKYCGEVTLNFNIKPEATQITGFSNEAEGLLVSWEAVYGAGGYYVYRKSESDSQYSKVATITDGEELSWLDDNVKDKAVYYYYVIAYKSTAKSAKSDAQKYYRLGKVTTSSFKSTSSKKATFTWKSKSGVTGYQVAYGYKKDDLSGWYVTPKMNSTPISSTSKTLTGLTSGKTCYVMVRACKVVSGKYYYGVWSTKKSVKIK